MIGGVYCDRLWQEDPLPVAWPLHSTEWWREESEKTLKARGLR